MPISRILGMFGLGFLFLAISPNLRTSLMDGMAAGVEAIERYQPLSYVGLAVLAVGGGMMVIHRSSQPR